MSHVGRDYGALCHYESKLQLLCLHILGSVAYIPPAKLEILTVRNIKPKTGLIFLIVCVCLVCNVLITICFVTCNYTIHHKSLLISIAFMCPIIFEVILSCLQATV